MGITVVTSSASQDRIAYGRKWLDAKRPAEEVLIVGATLGAANELARSLAQARRASFGYHRMSWAQLASALARSALTARRIVPLGSLGIQAIANRTIHKLSEIEGLGRYAKLTNGPGFARAIANVIAELRLEQIQADLIVPVAPDLHPLLQAYEQELVEHGFTDWPGVLRIAASEAMDRISKHQLLGLPTLLLDVPLTTASDVGLVRALRSRYQQPKTFWKLFVRRLEPDHADHKRPSQRSLLPSFSVRGHRPKIVLGVLIVILCPDRVADLSFGAGERQIPLIVSLRVLRAGAGGTRCPPLRACSK